MKKILIIGTGGTIASKKGDRISLDSPLKILDYVSCKNVKFDCVSPFCVFSENIDFDNWQRLINCLEDVDFDRYDGVIILHGSDTLAYTGALLANLFYDKTIVLVASDKPVEQSGSNAAPNFERAVEFISEGVRGVYISFDRLYRAIRTTSADENDEFYAVGKGTGFIKNPVFTPKNILVIKPYINIDYKNYNLDGVDAVLHTMYHSATAPESVRAFEEKCKARNIPFYFVTAKSRADYETARDFENIIFNSTVENAYARLLLTK